jgi:hypothetical protein
VHVSEATLHRFVAWRSPEAQNRVVNVRVES